MVVPPSLAVHALGAVYVFQLPPFLPEGAPQQGEVLGQAGVGRLPPCGKVGVVIAEGDHQIPLAKVGPQGEHELLPGPPEIHLPPGGGGDLGFHRPHLGRIAGPGLGIGHAEEQPPGPDRDHAF